MELHSKLQSESQRLELRNVVEIAQRLGRSYMAIVSRLQRLGLMDRLGNRILKLNEKGGAQ